MGGEGVNFQKGKKLWRGRKVKKPGEGEEKKRKAKEKRKRKQ